MSELTAKMTNEQYRDYRKAKKIGDDETAQKIWDGGYGPEYKEGDAFIVDVDVVDGDDDTADILDDVAGGMENKDIYKKYGISAQKLAQIKKGAK